MKHHLLLMLPLILVATAPEAQEIHSTTYATPQGELVVHWGQPAARDYGTAPAFASLAHGATSISEAEAAAYPPLANDFLYADSNRDGRISATEYARWSRR